MKNLLPWLSLLLLTACNSHVPTQENVQLQSVDQRRPAFHFTPPSGWMNDPNGMVYHDGIYHLFYQHNPDDIVWGPMHWGHATSKDLVNWEHRPIALSPDKNGTIFSGSAVVDKNNTSGLGSEDNPPLVAMYTYHDAEREKAGFNDFQTQGIAYSLDNGNTWKKVADNPVLANPGKRVFRDPKVTWHAPSNRWVMVLTQGNTIGFYTSEDLLNWQYQSEFGAGVGAHGGVWECPDLIRMRVPGTDEYRYVLIVSLVPGGPNGGSGTQYFVGDFDGTAFSLAPDNAAQLQPEPAVWPQGNVFDDFENGYANWRVEGEAFGAAPASGAISPQTPVSGFQGAALVNSFNGGDAPTGRMQSKEFVISAPYINFRIGGGRTSATELQLWVNNQKVATQSGNETEHLSPASFDVQQYQGKSAFLVVKDTATGGWGHILVDDIQFATQPAIPMKENANWLDYGPDNYAGVTFSNVRTSNGNPIFMGWANNWSYANVIPATSWRGALSLPRMLFLYQDEAAMRLGSRPVEALSERFKRVIDVADVTLGDESETYDLSDFSATYRITLSMTTAPGNGAVLRLSNSKNEAVALTIRPDQNALSLDRSKSGKTAFNAQFSERIAAAYSHETDELSLQLIYDKGVIEVFVNGGKASLTTLVFPQQDYHTLSLSSENKTRVRSLAIDRS